MPLVNDLNSFGERADEATLAAAAQATQSQFVRGMRSGGSAALGSLNNIAGAVGQQLGADEFATGRYRAADEHMQDAAASAPRVASMRDVKSFGDFADYAAGLAGGIVPVGGAALGATLLTGGGAIPAIAAGTGVMAPVEAGDIVGRMREQGRPVDLPAAVLGGTGSAALQNVLPGVARARLGGTGGRLPGGPLAAIPEQAALAAGSEAGKQVVANPSAPLDAQQIGDAAAGGAVMGVPIAGMSALGGARGQIGAAADAVGGKVKEAAQFVGDKAKGAAGKAQDVASATGDAVSGATADGLKRVEGMEIPDALSRIFDEGKARARGVMDKIAASDDIVGDVTKFAGLQGEKLKQALAGDDGERLQAVKDYAKELGDQHPAVRDWLQDSGNTAKQAAVAAAKKTKDAAGSARDQIKRFADAVNARRTTLKDGVRKSEDDSGIREALAQKLIPELLKARPELADMASDLEVARDLHRAFSPLIEDLASGRRPSSDVIARLIDLAGPAADKLVETAYSVVGDSTNPAKTRAFFKGLNDFTQVRDSSDKLVQTMRKSLSKGQERMTDAELREEAALLSKWRDDKRPIDGPNADPVAQRLNYTVQKHLEMRYGANAEKVLAALEKAKPREENQLERARVKYDEDGQPIDSGVEDGYGDTDEPSGRMQFFGGGRSGKDLFPHPDDDPGKNGYPGAAMQKMERVKTLHKDSTTRFVTATEMGLDHPWVKDKYKALVKMGNESGVDGERFARQNLDRYGVIATERALQKTQLSFDELDAMKLDRKRYADSKSRVDAGDNVVLDAVKVVRSMTERFKDEPYSPGDERSRVARMGRMFIEGIAAAQDYLGRSFDIPDSTVLGKLDTRDVTWGQVKKLDTRTVDDRMNDDVTKQLVALRRQFKATEDKALRAELAKEAEEIAAPRQLAKNKELTREDNRMQLDDALDFEGDVERGVNVDKRPLREAVRAVQKQIEEVGKLLDGEAAFGQGPEEVKLRKQLAQLNTQLDALRARQERATPGESLGSGQREIDPFGQIHQAAGFDARRDPEPINRDRSQQSPSLLGPSRKKPRADAAPPADDAPTAPRDRVAEQQSWVADALKDDVATFKTRTAAFDAGKLSAMVEVMTAMDRPKGIPPGRWRTAIDDARSRLEQAGGAPPLDQRTAARVDALAASEDYSSLDTRPKVDAFLAAARKRFDELRNTDGDLTEQQNKALGTLYGLFGEGSTADLASFYDGIKEEPQSPKVVAAKKAAFLERARSGDDSLIAEVKRHTDAVGLQNAVIHLARKGDPVEPNTARVIDALNERIGELVREQPQQAYDMLKADRSGGKKYSLDRGGPANDESRVLSFPDRKGERLKASVSAIVAELSPEDFHTLQNDVLSRDPNQRQLPSLLRERFKEWVDDYYSSGEREAVMSPERQGETERQFLEELIDAGNDEPLVLAMAQAHLSGATLKSAKSMESVSPNAAGPINRKEVYDYINRTLGNSVRLAWEKLGYAGEFERVQGKGNAPTEDVIRLSVHAMNPLSTAYHESLHAFMRKLSDQKHGRIMDVLLKAGESAPVVSQLRKWMAERGMGDKALAQLKDPEERAAYMYQAWADGKLNVGPETKTVLGKIADFIRSVLGIWSNDQRALHIMEYFHSGDFAKNMGNRDQVYNDLMTPGTNKAIEATRKMTQPILRLGENLAVAGGQRLRDTGIPALRELADQMKLHTIAEGDDPGFVPAARAERTRVMNKMAADLKGYSPEAVQAALESLQSLSNKSIDALAKPEDRLAAKQAKKIVRGLLDDMYQYMSDAGVRVNDLGVGKDYFPRVWDISYISNHQAEFLSMVNKYVQSGQYKGDPKKLLHKLMVSEGAEFTAEVDKPGMQHLKPRELAFMTADDTAPFMRKDLPMIINGYVTQATRRAEWARRFRDDGKGIDMLLARAKLQGATDADIDAAQKFVRSVDGTLGDTINPEARRLFGNMIVYQNVRLLPLMIFSSVVDPMGIAVRGGTLSDAFGAFKRGVKEIPKNFKKDAADDEATKFAASVGTIDDTALTHTLGALYSQGMVGDTGRKINDALFRYNLAEQFNTSMRVSATEAAMGFLARHADGKASKHSMRWLSELGLEPGDIKLGADGRVLVHEADGLTLEQSAKMKAAINRWVDGAVLRPDAVDKPIWMSDPHFSLIAHLKQFTYSFHETILKRVAHEYQHGNYAPAMALASYVPMMIAADMAKGLIQGGGEEPSWKENWGLSDYVAAGIERAGLLGVGQFGVDMLRDAQRGGTGVGALAGPTIEQFADAAQVLGGRESFGGFFLKSMPANALYAGALGGESTDPKFVD